MQLSPAAPDTHGRIIPTGAVLPFGKAKDAHTAALQCVRAFWTRRDNPRPPSPAGGDVDQLLPVPQASCGWGSGWAAQGQEGPTGHGGFESTHRPSEGFQHPDWKSPCIPPPLPPLLLLCCLQSKRGKEVCNASVFIIFGPMHRQGKWHFLAAQEIQGSGSGAVEVKIFSAKLEAAPSGSPTLPLQVSPGRKDGI